MIEMKMREEKKREKMDWWIARSGCCILSFFYMDMVDFFLF